MTISEEAGFLAALLADPFDEVTRSIYADWLDERGDCAGAYLRRGGGQRAGV